MDVFTANLESKSTLRAVVARFVRENPEVIYFPAYEMANMLPAATVFEEDMRHVKREFATNVVQNFLRCYSKDQ